MPDPQRVHVTASSLRLDQPQPLAGAEWRKAARTQQAAQAKTARNRRGKKPQPPITGYRKAT